MKILHVIGALIPEVGGPAKACVEMAQAVAQLGHEVAIYTLTGEGEELPLLPTDKPLSVANRGGVEILYFAVTLSRFWSLWAPSWPLAAALKKAIPRFDLVHIHSVFLFTTWAAGHYCQRYDVPYLLRPHGSFDPYIYRHHHYRKAIMGWLFQNKMTRQAAAVHYTTDEEGRLAAPYAYGAPGVVVPIGLNPGEYERRLPKGAFRSRHPEIGDKEIILFLGRLNFKKGLEILSETFATVARTRADVHLVIAGPDEGIKAKTETRLVGLGARERVTFTGMLLDDDKLALLSDSSVFVLPSHSENFGIAVVEAMACGLPVVISDKVNIHREVAAAGAGLVGPPEAETFTRLILEVLNDPVSARRMGAAGKALVAERFDRRQIAVTLEKVYDAIISGRDVG